MSDEPNAHTIGRIRDAFDHELEPVPGHLLSAAHDAFGWRSVDAQLAELLFDSASDELVGVRGAATDRRSFRFGADDFVIRVHLTDETMIVMIEPPLSLACRVSIDDAPHRTDAHRTDELGELAIDAPELPARIEIDLPSRTFVTPWITG